jgi:hypothetical protein
MFKVHLKKFKKISNIYLYHTIFLQKKHPLKIIIQDKVREMNKKFLFYIFLEKACSLKS